MNKVLNAILILFGLIALLLALAWVYLEMAFGDMCVNQIHSQSLSPNKKLNAVIFQRDCGATTGFSTQISIIKSDAELKNEKGNLYIIDGQPDEVAPRLEWENNEHLHIFSSPFKKAYLSETRWGTFNKVTISYGAKAVNKTINGSAPAGAEDGAQRRPL